MFLIFIFLFVIFISFHYGRSSSRKPPLRFLALSPCFSSCSAWMYYDPLMVLWQKWSAAQDSKMLNVTMQVCIFPQQSGDHSWCLWTRKETDRYRCLGVFKAYSYSLVQKFGVPDNGTRFPQYKTCKLLYVGSFNVTSNMRKMHLFCHLWGRRITWVRLCNLARHYFSAPDDLRSNFNLILIS